MIVRKIREEEFRRTLEVFSIAFEAELSPNAASQEELTRIRTAPASRWERYWLERWAAFNDQNGMMGFLLGFPANVRFDGHEAVCTCIGDVSCLPAYRRQGVIASCFRQHLADSFEQGAVFSYLYPFSTVFYRQFGYELCAQTVEWRIDVDAIPAFPEIKGFASLNEAYSEREALAQIYRQSMAEYNLSFLREDCDWNRFIGQQPAAQHRYTYVWRNADGVPKGCFTFGKEYDAQLRGSIMICTDFHAVDDEGMKGLLQFIRSFRSHYKRVHLPMPVDVRLERILPEVSSCERRIGFTGMGRIINVRRALELARYQGSGTVNIAVADPQVDQNNGIFKVNFQDGRCTDITAGTHADVSLDIAAFSRLLLGGCSPEEYARTPLAAVFYPKRMYISDFF